MSSVFFRSADRRLLLSGKTGLKEFIRILFKKEKILLGSITYIFCSDEYLLMLNRDFLQHDYYTDIISFGLSEKGQPVVAEVYISLERVKDNATLLQTKYRDEVLRVIFHGALHLCGYKDKTKSEIALMRSKEDRYLHLYEKFCEHA